MLKARGISVTAVTKAALGTPEIVNEWLRAGVSGLSDSRIENFATIDRANIVAPKLLVRSPMLSQVDRVVLLTNSSCNTELDVIRGLSKAANKVNRTHGILLMVELGDLREGIMPKDLDTVVREVLQLPNLKLEGIGTNLACRSGVSPDSRNMAELSALADQIDATFGPIVEIVSGGNSANLNWALSRADTGRINHLRLGEALLLGREPLHRQAINGLHTDAFTLFAEVIESKRKPTQAWGTIAQAAFGEAPPSSDKGRITQTILAIGRQDIEPDGLEAPLGIEILSASSDHLVVNSSDHHCKLKIGSEIPFQLNYGALLRAMTSPHVARVMKPNTQF